jgi:hypothetical protein
MIGNDDIDDVDMANPYNINSEVDATDVELGEEEEKCYRFFLNEGGILYLYVFS